MLHTMNERRLFMILIYLILLLSGMYLCGLLIHSYTEEIRPINEDAAVVIIMLTTAVFVFASAVPFVPGAEIGFGMMLMLGGKIAPLVYMAMVSALTISFQIGKRVPIEATVSVFGFLGLSKAQDFALSFGLLTPDKRLEFLFERAPSRILPFLLQYRYLALILMINLPGNSLIGGGGGIAFIAGLCGLFSLPRFLLAIAIAVLPIPATYYFMG